MTGTFKKGLGVIIFIGVWVCSCRSVPRPWQIHRLIGANGPSLLQTLLASNSNDENKAPSHGGVQFSFDRVEPNSKFSKSQKIAAMMERLLRQCQNTQRRNAPPQMVIDAARELVAADDEYKAQQSQISAFFFAYPYARDATFFSAGAVTGATFFWLIT